MLAPESFPVVRRGRPREQVHCFTAVAASKGRLLLHRRPDDAEWLAGRWHLPTVELDDGDEPTREAVELLQKHFGGRFECGGTESRVRHAVTYRDIVVRVAPARWTPDPCAASVLRWFDRDEIGELPTSSLLRKTLAAVGWSGSRAGAPPDSVPIHSEP